MQISTKGRYALRLMLDLAVHNTGERVKIKDISARENISEKYLEQIISSLKKAGYVKSLRGAHVLLFPAICTTARVLWKP